MSFLHYRTFYVILDELTHTFVESFSLGAENSKELSICLLHCSYRFLYKIQGFWCEGYFFGSCIRSMLSSLYQPFLIAVYAKP